MDSDSARVLIAIHFPVATLILQGFVLELNIHSVGKIFNLDMNSLMVIFSSSSFFVR